MFESPHEKIDALLRRGAPAAADRFAARLGLPSVHRLFHEIGRAAAIYQRWLLWGQPQVKLFGVPVVGPKHVSWEVSLCDEDEVAFGGLVIKAVGIYLSPTGEDAGIDLVRCILSCSTLHICRGSGLRRATQAVLAADSIRVTEDSIFRLQSPPGIPIVVVPRPRLFSSIGFHLKTDLLPDARYQKELSLMITWGTHP